MSDIEDRLRSWFAHEVGRAERDLATSRVATTRVRDRRRVPVAAVAGLAVALVVVAVAVRPATSPEPGKGPNRSPASSPISERGVMLGADGLPTSIDGEPILRVEDAARSLPSATEPLSVAGWYEYSGQRCAAGAKKPHPLIPACGFDHLLPARNADPDAGLAVLPSRDGPAPGAVVLRLHMHDVRAATCLASRRPDCDRAIVVDEVLWQIPDPMTGRYADGIPGDISGETVVRVGDLPAGDQGSGSFLLGGWHGQDRWFGCGRLGETHPLLDDCSPEWIADAPGGRGRILMQAREIQEGPLVIRVHTDDPRSATCPENERILCKERLVVDELVWAGDAVTNTEPLAIDDVVMALRTEISGLTVEVAQPSRTCDPGWPDISWVSISATGITNVMVFPTIAAREAVDQNFRSSGWTGLDGCSVDAYGDPWHWVAVDNVMVSTTDALADRTRLRLEALAP